jgi:hypothetical protein
MPKFIATHTDHDGIEVELFAMLGDDSHWPGFVAGRTAEDIGVSYREKVDDREVGLIFSPAEVCDELTLIED